ncbi:hypothetical protein ACSSS7_003802 [Eimeria intestinalis]
MANDVVGRSDFDAFRRHDDGRHSFSIVHRCVLLSANAEFLVSSIETVVADYGLPESFIGVILLPIVGNAAEHLTAVTVAMKNKVDLAMGVAVGSSAQIALFVFPFTVLVAWAMGQPLTLAVQPLNAVVMLLSVLVAMGE